VFALATGRWSGGADTTTIGALAAEVLADAIVRAVKQATAVAGVPAARDVNMQRPPRP
jgi:L-aminopeptidase/D-esterase-like protein